MTINPSNIFAQKDLLGFQDLVADELNKIPTTENPKVVATALKNFLENKPMEESLSPSLKNRLVPIQELLDNPDNYVQEEEKYEAFRQIIRGRIQEEVDYLENMSPESQTKRVEFQEKKETKKVEEKEMFEKLTKQAASRLNERTTETLHEFLSKQVEEGRIGGEWKMEVLIGHEAVIDHYLMLKNYLSRDDFLNLTVTEFLELGDPTNEAEYAVRFKESNRPLSLTDIQLAVKRKALLQKIRDVYPSEITHLISSSPIFQKDKEVILEAVKRNGRALEYASLELKNDKDIVLEAVKQNGRALVFASDDLKINREVFLEAVKQDGRALQFASDVLKADREVVLEAVKQTGWALQFTSATLKADRDVVLKAVKQGGFALQFASDDLKADRDVVLEAIKQNGALAFASATLKADRDVVLKAVKQDGFALQFAYDDLKADREVVLEAVKQTKYALRFVSDDLKKDREIKELISSREVPR